MKAARTRFAPSPTGYMHVGGVRTALFAWLLARQTHGQFILRLEDTDKVREVEGSDRHIMDSLRWLGLEWDEGPDKGGPYGPYRQSERLDSYKVWGQKLVDQGRAYADPYSLEQLEGFREQAKSSKQPFLFRNHRPVNPPKWDGSQPLRFKSEPKAYVWQDEVMGELSAGEDAVDDFIIIKSDGYPTYNFAHIVDDELMRITHVIRSQEFLASVPRYLNLYEALDLTIPSLATLPYVLAAGGKKKLSKRDGAKDILDYAREGYVPAALVNFLATLGWNDGTEQEIFTIKELIKKFSLDRVQRGGAIFDEQRLLWMDGSHIRNLTLTELSKRAGPFWPVEAKTAKSSYKSAVLGLVQERLKYLAELPQLSLFFFIAPDKKDLEQLFTHPTDKQLKKLSTSEIRPMLESVISSLESSDFSQTKLEKVLNTLLEELQTKPGILFAIIRVALTGSPASPPIAGCLEVIGKPESLKRLDTALSVI